MLVDRTKTLKVGDPREPLESPTPAQALVFGENRPGAPGLPAIKEEHQAHGREDSCANRPKGNLAGNHRAGRAAEPLAARMGELLSSRDRQQSVSGARQLHSCAVAPVVARQAQGQAT